MWNRPSAAPAIKTGDGHDYYDVIALGGGTAGCMIAGRLAERGVMSWAELNQWVRRQADQRCGGDPYAHLRDLWERRHG